MAKVYSAASLVLYGKAGALGWRRGAVILSKNGQPKPGVMLINGAEVQATNLSCQIRTYADRKPVHKSVGTDYREALDTLQSIVLKRKRVDAVTLSGQLFEYVVSCPLPEHINLICSVPCSSLRC